MCGACVDESVSGVANGFGAGEDGQDGVPCREEGPTVQTETQRGADCRA